jgi:hypothetical protein
LFVASVEGELSDQLFHSLRDTSLAAAETKASLQKNIRIIMEEYLKQTKTTIM